MKQLILFLAILSSSGLLASTEKVTKSKIEKVTVYLSGAEVQRSSAVSLSPGNTIIVFDELEQGIDARSIQASGTGNFIILDVKHKVKYPDQNPALKTYSKNYKEIRLLEDSIRNLDYDLEEISNKQEVLNTERNVLLTNKLITGGAKSDTLPVLKDVMVFLKEKLNNINSELLKLKKEQQRLTAKKTRIELNLSELRSFENMNASKLKSDATYQLLVTVSTEASTQATITVNYLLLNAGWTPTYDLRTISTSNSMQLTYKANVYQTTGTDWNDVKLTLSTSNPHMNNSKPVLSVYFLNYYNVYTKNRVKKMEYENDKLSKSEITMANVPSMTVDVESKSTADYTTMQETLLNYEYSIKIPYTIPSDGQTHIVAVQNKDVPADFQHFGIPKVDNNAFLLARMSGWDDLNLIPGSANVFFDGSYVGQTFIDPDNTNDTLELSVGRDKSIVMKRVKLKDKTKEKILADEKVQTVTYEITIRNTKSIASKIVVEDQIPVSQNKEIKVELKDGSGGNLDANTGKLNWTLNIKPKETKKILITYEVRCPKDKMLSGL
jgi:uncharacterized protein (TIGR02231 family)